MSGIHQGRLSAHFGQNSDHVHSASTSPTKNCTPPQAESNQGSQMSQCSWLTRSENQRVERSHVEVC